MSRIYGPGAQVQSSASNALYVYPLNMGATAGVTNSTAANVTCIFPLTGTISLLGIDIASNASTSNDTITFYLNGSPTALQVTITATTIGAFQDSTHTINVSAGDRGYFALSQSTTSLWAGQMNWVYTA